uniref:Uncharacterized protein n=1 Tax=Strongyloides stercoralis TaxID=6248 RepID=A0A0K0ENJ4_STRER
NYKILLLYYKCKKSNQIFNYKHIFVKKLKHF